MPQTYTVKQVADILGYSTNSIYSFLKEKRIKGVRVGKGRFRIPQSEMDRLLLSSGKKTVSKQTALAPSAILPSVVIPDGIAEAPDLALATHHIHLFGPVKLTLPNIFDWFIGVSAVITGIALFTFNRSFESSAVLQVVPIINAMRTALICAGLGVLISTFTGARYQLWHRIFQGLLVAIGSVLIVMLFRVNDIDGAFLYATLAATIAITMVLRLPGIASFLLYLTLLGLSAPFIPLIGRDDPTIATTLTRFAMTPAMLSLVFAIVGVAISVSFWVGYTRQRRVFEIVSWLAAAGLLFAAFYYAQGGFWSRAFHFIIMGLTTMFLPSWVDLRYTRSRREQLIVHTIFGTIFFILLVAVMVISVMQGNLVEHTKGELSNKVRAGQTLLTTALEGAADAVVSAAGNPEFGQAVVKKDQETMTLLSKVLYESSDTIRRVVILDKDGKGLSLYPFGTFDVEDLSFREYYRVPKETGAPFVSDLFEALADQSKRKAIVVSAPLLSEKGTFEGVLAGSVDLDFLGVQLQKIATENREEYFAVVDSQGTRLIHPDPKAIGEVIRPDDPLRKALAGEELIADDSMRDGRRALAAAAPVSAIGKQWAIGIRAPTATVTLLTLWANITVLTIVVACVVIAGGLITLLHASRGPTLHPPGEDTS